MICDEKKKKKKKRDMPLFVLFYGLELSSSRVFLFFFYCDHYEEDEGDEREQRERVSSRLIVAYFCFVVIRLMARSNCILETRFFELPGPTH